jgi:antitoxin ParD1/3/4
VNVSLTRELEQFVRDRVGTGRYHSASEVVREGLRLLESREQLRELQLDEMRKRLAAGEDDSRASGRRGLRRLAPTSPGAGHAPPARSSSAGSVVPEIGRAR